MPGQSKMRPAAASRPPTLWKLPLLSTGRGIRLPRRFDDLLREAQVAIEPVTETQARIARAAYRDFGKGSGHPAKLNFGDCFAYALAKVKDEALLFKGDDFSRTDIRSALG